MSGIVILIRRNSQVIKNYREEMGYYEDGLGMV